MPRPRLSPLPRRLGLISTNHGLHFLFTSAAAVPARPHRHLDRVRLSPELPFPLPTLHSLQTRESRLRVQRLRAVAERRRHRKLPFRKLPCRPRPFPLPGLTPRSAPIHAIRSLLRPFSCRRRGRTRSLPPPRLRNRTRLHPRPLPCRPLERE
ncbi:uncharacterized protein BKA78DRAFT_316795 [Phyllosticta capitalensis]|uniref:uncharacterized protein n=1 Tax=Phyllosticta capitalensis TaxID=121624 RepID=UPI00312E92F6